MIYEVQLQPQIITIFYLVKPEKINKLIRFRFISHQNWIFLCGST